MAKDQWWIRDVDDEVKRKYKAYAVLHGLKLGEALAKIIEIIEKQNI